MTESIPINLNSAMAKNGTPTNFTYELGSSIYLNPQNRYLIYLKKFLFYNSVKNITAEKNNNKIKYFDGFEWITFTFEDGAYNIDDMNRALYEYFQDLNWLYDVGGVPTSPIYFEPFAAIDKIRVNLKPGYKIDFSVGRFCDRIGFYDTDLITVTQTGRKTADITDHDNILIHCSLTSNTITNGYRSDVIENVPITVPPGSQQVYEPKNITYCLINTSNISSIQMRITDQEGTEIKLDDAVSYDMSIIQSQIMNYTQDIKL